MTNEHPITPPPELVQKWIDAPNWLGLGCHPARMVPDETYATRLAEAAQWGADQELEAIEKEILDQEWFANPEYRLAQLRAARRPKPLSLKERLSKAIVDGVTRKELKLLEELDDSALEAAADQVTPANGSRRNNEIRADILTIAAELRGTTTETL